jgi:PIN domain nuclease of toxin-antitoxin system
LILLDTCAVIWDALDRGQLSPAASAAIERNDSELMICDISIWEIAMLIDKGRLQVAAPAAEFIRLALQSRNYYVQEITPEIAELSTRLRSELTADPADRLIAATSILLNAPLVTADERLRSAGAVRTVW